MSRDDLLLWGLGGAIVFYAYQNQTALSRGVGALKSGVETVTAAVSGWQNVNDGPTWVPVLNQTEQALGIPTNLLARIAYQESHFRPEIIDGTQASPAGALGLMQLMPQYFTGVNVAIPFQPADTVNQISEAGEFLMQLYQRFNDWGAAVAAYNDGATNIAAYLAGTRALPTETRNYVAEVLTDIPVPTNFQA